MITIAELRPLRLGFGNGFTMACLAVLNPEHRPCVWFSNVRRSGALDATASNSSSQCCQDQPSNIRDRLHRARRGRIPRRSSAFRSGITFVTRDSRDLECRRVRS
jgi:hypothetical protein